MQYDSRSIEQKWQACWARESVYRTDGDPRKKKYYVLVEFPYPSGNGLHVGHARPYTAMDVVARRRRMQGFDVLFPMGWDAFGLPTENYAIANKIHPAEVTRRNITFFKSQINMMGYSFDWDREVNTTDPGYYRWTQWIFLRLLEHGLAYKARMPVNWCTSCKCVLANEEVVDGVCERCGSEVVRREKSQWMLKITAYAQRLLDDLGLVEYPERVKAQQRNWIGRSEGADVDFATTAGEALRVYTTRPDTLFGATYMVISPEHPYVEAWRGKLENYDEVAAYRASAARKSDFERTELQKDKTGVRLLGVDAVNPATGGVIPIFVSDYVLMSYGTGAIMAVPGHDERDWDFARTFGLPIVEVVAGGDVQAAAFADVETGTLVNSGFLNGMEVRQAKAKMIEWLVGKGLGRAVTNYKLRDWVFSRQRYWGEPIPVLHCPACGAVPVPETELPLLLPEVASYEPTDTGESPLSKMRDWVDAVCPRCGGPAERETDTMPQWAGSSWYFLRYIDPKNEAAAVDGALARRYMPVDWYNGGMEHTTLHLLYSRFWHKFLYDIGVVETPEPYVRRTSHGMILGEGGEKMSKSRGNVVSPNEIVDQYGADTMRLYILFIGDFEKAASWSPQAVKGCRRFLERVWGLLDRTAPGEISTAHEAEIHRAIRKVGEDIEHLKFNTAIAALMALVNRFYETGVTKGDLRVLLTLLSPFAPHICEEMWEQLGCKGFVVREPWPAFDPAKTVEDEVEIAVQVGGKLRATVVIPTGAADEDVLAAALAEPRIRKTLDGRRVTRHIYVKDKLINLIAGK
ncbi:MAG: leucine--tRNA ligase [Oscillospiraceae bacterium]|nr:leucine--tRNA ligase [Oscillospiraceae bacterium]